MWYNRVVVMCVHPKPEQANANGSYLRPPAENFAGFFKLMLLG